MLTTTIRESQRGLLFHDGRLVRLLGPGRYLRWLPFVQREIERLELDRAFTPWTPELERVLPTGAAELVCVGPSELAVLLVDEIPAGTLPPGRWLLWQQRRPARAELLDLTPLQLEVPAAYVELLPADRVCTVHVPAGGAALVLDGGKLVCQLSEGRHALSRYGRSLEVQLFDGREAERTITGQEVMTADKVSLRLNLIVKYRIAEPARALTAVSSVHDAIYSEAQLSCRRYVGSVKLDGLLAGRGEAAASMRAELEPRLAAMGVQLVQVDLKDLILPGDMKLLLNRVIEAEKQAAAQAILRREETASTRSLANTARVLEGNPTLMRLKEMEAMRDIADRVGQLTVVSGGGELLAQLGGASRG